MRSLWIAVLAMLVVLMATTTQVSADNNNDEAQPMCVCPRNLSPVCGSDNKTYSNRCLLHCQMDSPQGRSVGLRMSHKGRCGN